MRAAAKELADGTFSITLPGALSLLVLCVVVQTLIANNVSYGDYAVQQGIRSQKGRVTLNDVQDFLPKLPGGLATGLAAAAVSVSSLSLLLAYWGEWEAVARGTAALLLVFAVFFAFKSLTISATLVPHPPRSSDPISGPNLNCVNKSTRHLNPVQAILSSIGGMSPTQNCTDFMPSAHTFVTCVIAFIAVVYTDGSGLAWGGCLLAILVAVTLPLAREHYTSDVLVALSLAFLTTLSAPSWLGLMGLDVNKG